MHLCRDTRHQGVSRGLGWVFVAAVIELGQLVVLPVFLRPSRIAVRSLARRRSMRLSRKPDQAGNLGRRDVAAGGQRIL